MGKTPRDGPAKSLQCPERSDHSERGGFCQEQFNINSLAGTSNSTFAVGLGGGWEAGFNLVNYYTYDKTKKLASDPDATKAPWALMAVFEIHSLRLLCISISVLEMLMLRRYMPT